MLRPRAIQSAIVVGLLTAGAYGAGPDVIVSALFGEGSSDTILGSYGSEDPNGNGNRISAFSVGTVSCNVGTQNLDWFANTNQHPAIHQSMFRLKDNRFEQIGMGWIKHGFFALNQPYCTFSGLTCIPPPHPNPGTSLHVGCSDPYDAGLNANRFNLGPTWEINAHTGFFRMPFLRASATTAPIPNRLQVHSNDVNPDLNAGAIYFVQGHYVHPDDAFAGNGNNNASYREVIINRSLTDPNRYNGTLTDETQRMQSAVRAWQDQDPSVVEVDAQVPGEGLFILAAKATNLGNGFFRYEYALQNLNSDRSGGSFTVPIPEGVSLDNIGFHDVDYHSGDGPACPTCLCSGGSNHGNHCNQNPDCPPNGTCVGPHLNFDGADWEATVEVGKITWASTPYDDNPNANALRWSTLYNFRFDANIGPDEATVTLGLFKPGTPSEVSIPQSIGPRVGLIDCNGNSIPDSCDVSCNGLGCYPPCGPRCSGGPSEGLSCAGHVDCPEALCGGLDCNGNGVPDECEADCNNNDIPDFCDITPQECEPDCDGNGFPDEASEDCQPNTIPDECENDCDGDSLPDTCETITDSDGDGVEDCDDDCPLTTPAEACLPPYTQIVNCCFSNGFLETFYTWSQCVTLCAGDPNPQHCGPVCDDPPTCPGTPCRESFCRDGCLMGDFDRDGDLDLFDTGALQSCYSAAIGNPAFVTPSAECRLRFDIDNDGDVDLEDVDEFLGAYTGP